MSAPDNPPAFPHVTQSKRAGSDTIYTHVSKGMTLRDWFAGQAIARHQDDPRKPAIVAAECYQLADALLAERAKGGAA